MLVWEDIHWADEGMLDLIEHLVQWVRAPVLQVCLARDELLTRRPGWGGVRRDATTMFLEPLGEDETRELIASLLDADASSERVIGEVAARAEGNPLFAEEMVRRLAEEEGASASELPATVQGLLAARLDSLESFQRRLLAHAAVDRAHVLGGRPNRCRRDRGRRSRTGAARAAGEGHHRRR